MYRSCIFCSAPLGSNDSVERFPVGRSLAFDAAKGRLWAVCGTCARWNLAPIEERWEAIESAERLFRDTHARVQHENIGMGRLRDGTRLVRVGQALAGELAAWRYGDALVQRRRRYLRVAAPLGTLGALGWLVFVPGAGILPATGMAAIVAGGLGRWIWTVARGTQPVMRLTPRDADIPVALSVFPEHLQGARMVVTDDGGIGVRITGLRHRHEWSRAGGARVVDIPTLLAGAPARHLLSRAMVVANPRGARRDAVLEGVERIAAAGTPEDYLRAAARDGYVLMPQGEAPVSPLGEIFETAPASLLALEMALHEETERRALHGELAMLEGMWREAEEIASIADALPDVPPPDPPRIIGG
ncbi:MAG TPA: hypothetical protein VEQ60_02470 [Longimicrobium sp.]|nr:hypothetical protein [Longimicrobium sp.]